MRSAAIIFAFLAGIALLPVGLGVGQHFVQPAIAQIPPTPTPTPLFFKTGSRVTCQLDNSFFYTFGVKTITGDWIYTTNVVPPQSLGVSDRPIWIRIDSLSACWMAD